MLQATPFGNNFHYGSFSTVNLLKVNEDTIATFDLYSTRYNPDLGSDCDSLSQTSTKSSNSQEGQSVSSPSSYGSDDSTGTWLKQEASSPSTATFENEYKLPSRISPPVKANTRPLQRLQQEVVYRPKPLQQPFQQPVSLEHPAEPHAQVLPVSSTDHDLSQRRRRGRSTGAVPPPQLRRDTDHTDAIVRMIVLFCTNLINSIWCTNGSMETEFVPTSGSNVLPLRVFITETLRRSKTSYSTLQIALYYLILLKQCLPPLTPAGQSGQSGCRAMQCGRRMFLTSLILASKYLQDRNYSARAWSKISGLPLKEINENERRFLGIVGWDLHVPKATFENWSKIVLSVCRRSMDPNSGCKEGADSPPKGPDTRPPRQCALSNMCNDFQALGHWWKVNLQKLRTDIVKCPVKTQQYVESVAPFRDFPYLSRPVSENSFEAAFTADCLDLNTTSTADQSQPSGLERIAKRFEPVPDLLHPAPQMTVPPPPVFANLPTPQTTPQTNLNCWTPKSNDQLSRPSMRCRASASALGSAFRKHCPMANLERCPPPKPRSFEQESRSCILPPIMPHAIPSTVSVTSSPESIVSDAASCAPRSRSSSISSTASWMTNLPAAVDVIEGSKDGYIVSHELQRAMSQYTNQRPRHPPISRLQNPCSQLMDPAPTVPGGPQVLPVLPDHKRSEHPFREHVLDEGYASADEAKKHGTVEVLAGLYIDTSVVDEGVVFSRAKPKPALGRSKTHVVDTARQEQVPRTQLMKRTHSESTDFADPAQHVAAFIASGNTGKVDYSTCFIPRAYLDTLTENKEILQPTQCWAEPRKPIQARTQGKRMCLSGMDTIHGVC